MGCLLCFAGNREIQSLMVHRVCFHGGNIKMSSLKKKRLSALFLQNNILDVNDEIDCIINRLYCTLRRHDSDMYIN